MASQHSGSALRHGIFGASTFRAFLSRRYSNFRRRHQRLKDFGISLDRRFYELSGICRDARVSDKSHHRHGYNFAFLRACRRAGVLLLGVFLCFFGRDRRKNTRKFSRQKNHQTPRVRSQMALRLYRAFYSDELC